MAEGLCWCASDSRCPHGISAKLPGQWEEMEKIVDEILQQFDRKSIRRYLKKDVDGAPKNALQTHLKDVHKASDDVKAMIDKVKSTRDLGPIVSPEMKLKKRRQDGPDSTPADGAFSKSMSAAMFQQSKSSGDILSLKRPHTSMEGGSAVGDIISASSNNQMSPQHNSRSKVVLPSLNNNANGTGNGHDKDFRRDLMSNTLPKLPARTGVGSSSGGAGGKGERKQAWATPTSTVQLQPPSHNSSVTVAETDHQETVPTESVAAGIPKTNPLNPAQSETVISAGLMRIADQLARKILPWQAVLCPRAVESLQDLRLSMIQAKHTQFMTQMKQKLEEKVTNFIRRKEEEVDAWLEREVSEWQKFLIKDESDLGDFVKDDLNRITQRALSQDLAYRQRELRVANELDDHERDETRQQLVNFRRIVRASKQAQPGHKSLFDQQDMHVEVRTLQNSIAKAQGSTKRRVADMSRNNIRRQEEAHDWLCSLADNAIAAQISEERLKLQYANLDGQRLNSMDSLHKAMAMYKEQHASILEAIVVFAGRIHQHASDYLQREQLVSRAFMQYLLAIVNGEIKTHTAEQKKNSYAWETKSLIDRGHRKETALINEFHSHMDPLEIMVSEFKEKMRLQLEHITIKLQSVVNGKENDINARKALIHKKLAKHVNKACNGRRQRLKDATAIRRDEFDLESRAMAKVEELCSDLKAAVDTFWVKEHLKERRIYEASLGRLERLEKSALIIWNKHAHIAVDQREEYHDWLETYKRDRDEKIRQRKLTIEGTYVDWAQGFSQSLQNLGSDMRRGFKRLIPQSFVYDLDATVEENIVDLEGHYEEFRYGILEQFQNLRVRLEEYIGVEMQQVDAFAVEKKVGLVQEWRENLFRLDDSINRRIGRLKDMEADLEETIRLTILQHEVENGVFEQLSCARYEGFWVDWRKKMQELSKELVTTQEDYELAKRGGKSKSRPTKQDRAIDDLIDVAKEPGGKSKQPSTPMKSSAQAGKSADGEHGHDSHSHHNSKMTDTMRIKVILDDIKAELYRDFLHKMTRSLEKVRRDLGEGKKQLIPPYAAAKVIAVHCERFYEKAKLNERCVGRISAKGVLLFQEGLPMHASAIFSMSTTCAMLTLLKMRGEFKFDCDDIFSLAENMKVFFLVGLLSLTSQYGEFGEYMIRSECLWACSTLEIPPPPELVRNSLARGIQESMPGEMKTNGIFSEDTVDLLNHLLEMPTTLDAVQAMTNNYQKELAMDLEVAGINDEMLTNQPVQPGGASIAFSEDPSGAQNYNREPQNVYQKLKTKVPLIPQLQKLQMLFPHNDVQIFAALLGRPEGSFEMTTHRVCQVISLWRRTSVAIALSALSPPNSEYPRIQDILAAHQASITGKKRQNYGNINCLSPFEAVSMAIDYISSIHGLPISVLQAMSLLSRGGSCDPWLEDPKQSCRHERLVYDVQEMLDVYTYRIPRSMIHDEYLQVTLPKTIADTLTRLDLNFSGVIPLEILRSYLQRDDAALTNNQVSMVFWSLCRVNEEFEDNMSTLPDTLAQGSHMTGGGFRPLVQTVFNSDPEDYMVRFGKDVDKYLDSMPTLDTNVVLGMVTNPLMPAAAHELVSDAMKLDPSARNPMPTTCCIWLGQRLIKADDALKVLMLPGNVSKDGNYVVGVTRHAFACGAFEANSIEAFVRKVRVYVELDLLTKYPEVCELRASDRHYGPAGNDPMVFNAQASEDNHWKELLTRRINRLDKLTISWRDTMLSEWAASLYLSRQMRYASRVDLVQKSVAVYHTQYQTLREAILSERGAMMSMYRGLENELMALIQDDYSLITYHSGYLDRALRRFEGEFERFWLVLKETMVHYVRHVGSIKRESINRVNLASIRLREELENSCNGMIVGYTAGYAQGFFDGLVHRGAVWRSTLTDLQGQLIVIKEKFMAAKDEIDRDLTIQITDRLTMDRTRCKFHLESLNEDTANMLDQVANTRASYAALQKDANARLILRIEKCIRESRKLRSAAEQQPELEGAVLRDIRVVLNIARQACLDIVSQIQGTCSTQLRALLPIRTAHRERMEQKVQKIDRQWQEVLQVMTPLVEDYEREMFKQLHQMNAHALELIHVYRETETKALVDQFTVERAALIAAFRKHFREYDLSESAIFERFNAEITRIVSDMMHLWGPSRPKFIMHALREFKALAEDSLLATASDVRKQMFVRDLNDDTTCARMAIADHFGHQLLKSADCASVLPTRYIKDREAQVTFIDDMSMAKNGDMVRPQVKAVLDLLVAGIEIDYDFGAGYENLVAATSTKASDSVVELQGYVTRYSQPEYPVSIPCTATLTRQRIQARQEEIDALLEASRTHLVADHSKLEVLFAAGEKDIEEWASLTLQLIENAFHNAEVNYMSNLWPSPEPTPRLELIPEDEDRVGKLKALLASTQQDTRLRSEQYQMIRAMGGSTVPGGDLEDLSYASGQNNYSPSQSRVDNLVAYKGDTKLLMDNLRISDEEEAEFQRMKEEKRLEKERRKREKELANMPPEIRAQALPQGKILPELQTREIQEGWFECIAPEGYTYYHNPVTGESLWDLPQVLKKPLRVEDEDESIAAASAAKLVDTPRELLMLEAGNLYAPETVPIRVVNAEFRLEMKIDPKVIMADVAEEARSMSQFAVDIAMDITKLIHGRVGKDERTIATLLGDRYDQRALRMKGMGLGEESDDEDDKVLRLTHMGEEAAEAFAKEGRDPEGGAMVRLNSKGQIIDDSIDKNKDGDGDLAATNQVEADIAQLLLELGVKGADEQEGNPLLQVTNGEVEGAGIPVDPEAWLQLGLGNKTRGDLETESSDGEDYTGFNQQSTSVQRKAARKYALAREIDMMAKEDQLSVEYENFCENQACHAFLTALAKVIDTQTAVEEDKEMLISMSQIIKPINVVDIMASVKTSWQQIDEIIAETAARARLRQERVEMLRTEEGRRRQQMILEHAEDTEEMVQFFVNNCQVSKVNAKRIAVELLTKFQCPTAKKLSKMVARGQVSLKHDLQLDDDDLEEVDAALKGLLLTTTMSTMSMSQPVSRMGSMMDVLPRATSFISPFANPLQQSQHLGSQHSLMQHSLSSQPQMRVPSTYQPQASTHSHSQYSSNSSHAQQPLILDPNLVTEVDDEYDDEESTKDPRLPRGGTGGRARARSNSSASASSGQHKPLTYSLTSDGFKSFHGGWIEGLSEDQQVYYYNVKTGQSSWHLPTMSELEEQQEEQRLQQQQLENLGMHHAPSSDSFGLATNNNSQSKAHEDPQHQADAPYFNASQLDPFGSFAQSQSQYEQEGGGDAGGPSTMSLVTASQLQATHSEQQHYDYAHQDSNADYGHTHNAANAEQAYDYQNYYNASDPMYQQQYDANGQVVYNPNGSQVYASDPQATVSTEYPGYYDEQGNYHYYDPQQQQHVYYDEATQQMVPYATDGNWTMSDALGVVAIEDYRPPPKPRQIPTQTTAEVDAFAQKEGVARQLVLLSTQDKWQNNLVKTQHILTEQKSQYLTKRVEMFEKASKLVEDRLGAFIEDIKFMQKTLKKELGEAVATQRDLRRLFEESSGGVMKAEKLSFVLESLEKLKAGVNTKYESAFLQIDKFAADWEILKHEMLQVGELYDTGIAANLDQCRMACEHYAKLFTYDQLKATATVAKDEMVALRRALHRELMGDTHEAEHAREEHRGPQIQYYEQRMIKKEELKRYYYGQGGASVSSYLTRDQEAFLEEELNNLGYYPLQPEDDLLSEEELAMAFLIKQIEMEASLRQDYESILDASKSMALDIQTGIEEFDANEKKSVVEDGSWFNKHRDTLERHEQALHVTLSKVRDRMNEGYQELQASIEALDFDVERAAEDELFQSSLHSK